MYLENAQGAPAAMVMLHHGTLDSVRGTFPWKSLDGEVGMDPLGLKRRHSISSLIDGYSSDRVVLVNRPVSSPKPGLCYYGSNS